MSGYLVIIGIFLFFYLVGEISEYFGEKSAAKKIPIVVEEIESLNKEIATYDALEARLEESEKLYRSDYERKKAQRAYFAQRKSQKTFRR